MSEGGPGIIVIVGIGVGFLQALVIVILTGIKTEVKSVREELASKERDIWKRVYAHYHEIDCSNDDCDARRTGNVIVPHDAT